MQLECDKLNYENVSMRAGGEHEKSEQANFVEQLRLKHDMETKAMRKERDALRARLQQSNDADVSRIKEVMRESQMLKTRVKALLDENDELRERLERAEAHTSSLTRQHARSLADLSSKVASLESEKESLKQQADNAYKETATLNETLADYLRKTHDAERDYRSLKLRHDELQHTCKRDVANVRLEMAKEKGELNRARETLAQQLDDMQLKLDVANQTIEMQRKMHEEKDVEMAKAINAINEENWTKISELANEK